MNHFSKQQCVDKYEFNVVYKVYFLKLYLLSGKYASVHIYAGSRIFGLYVTFCSRLYSSEIISIYIRHFKVCPLLSMKRPILWRLSKKWHHHVIKVSQWQVSLQLSMPFSWVMYGLHWCNAINLISRLSTTLILVVLN